MKIVYFRGTLIAKLVAESCKKTGSMLAVALSGKEVAPDLKELSVLGDIAVGCVNSPQNVTLTGDEVLINELKERFDARVFFARKLKVKVAYHSSQMEIIATEYGKRLRSLQPHNRNMGEI